MKKHNFMLASLLILVGMGAITVSCRKEQLVKSNKAQVEVVAIKEGGEDDDDPIIQGRVKKKNNFSPIDHAYVETISSSSNQVVRASYSNNDGEFEHQVPADTYYFRVAIPGGGDPITTDTVHISGNSIVTILVDL